MESSIPPHDGRTSQAFVEITGPFAEHERRSAPRMPTTEVRSGNPSSDPTDLLGEAIRSKGETAFYQAVLASMPDGVILASAEGVIASWNQAASRIFEIEAEEAVGDDLFHLLSEAMIDPMPILRVLQDAGKVENQRAVIVGRRQRHTHVLVSLNYVLDPSAQRCAIVMAIKDNSEVERLTRIDPLTGIANRREFDELITKAYEALGRGIGEPLSLIFLDVDDFKQVNTMHGHQVGDEVLRRVGEVLRQGTRSIDTAARFDRSLPGRYGGEEFVLILPGTDAAGALLLAERLRTKIAALRLMPEGCYEILKVTASFGIVTHACAGKSSANELVAQANRAMAAAKRLGKDRCVAAPSID